MEVVAFAMIIQAVVEDSVSGFRSKCDSIGFAERDEHRFALLSDSAGASGGIRIFGLELAWA
jgi:hypothetical protein